MSKPVLYLCHTPYHILASAAKVLFQPHPAHILLSQRIVNRAELAPRLTESGLFQQVLLPQDEDWPAPVESGWRAPFVHFFHKRAVERSGFRLDPSAYAEICIYNDWSRLGCYLQDLGADYTLGEDTYNFISHPHSWIEWQKQQPSYEKQRRTGKGYLYWGASPCTKVMEVAHSDQALYWKERHREFDTMQVLAHLTPAQRNLLCRIFLAQELPAPKPPCCLFLPRCFYIDDMVPSQQAQDRLCRDLVEQYAKGYHLYIKTHPRDLTDYTALFPDAVVLDRLMPSEVLDYCLDIHFDRAVGLCSYAIHNLRCADEILDLPESTLEQYQEP